MIRGGGSEGGTRREESGWAPRRRCGAEAVSRCRGVAVWPSSAQPEHLRRPDGSLPRGPSCEAMPSASGDGGARITETASPCGRAGDARAKGRPREAGRAARAEQNRGERKRLRGERAFGKRGGVQGEREHTKRGGVRGEREHATRGGGCGERGSTRRGRHGRLAFSSLLESRAPRARVLRVPWKRGCPRHSLSLPSLPPRPSLGALVRAPRDAPVVPGRHSVQRGTDGGLAGGRASVVARDAANGHARARRRVTRQRAHAPQQAVRRAHLLAHERVGHPVAAARRPAGLGRRRPRIAGTTLPEPRGTGQRHRGESQTGRPPRAHLRSGGKGRTKRGRRSGNGGGGENGEEKQRGAASWSKAAWLPRRRTPAATRAQSSSPRGRTNARPAPFRSRSGSGSGCRSRPSSSPAFAASTSIPPSDAPVSNSLAGPRIRRPSPPLPPPPPPPPAAAPPRRAAALPVPGTGPDPRATRRKLQLRPQIVEGRARRRVSSRPLPSAAPPSPRRIPARLSPSPGPSRNLSLLPPPLSFSFPRIRPIAALAPRSHHRGDLRAFAVLEFCGPKRSDLGGAGRPRVGLGCSAARLGRGRSPAGPARARARGLGSCRGRAAAPPGGVRRLRARAGTLRRDRGAARASRFGRRSEGTGARRRRGCGQHGPQSTELSEDSTGLVHSRSPPSLPSSLTRVAFETCSLQRLPWLPLRFAALERGQWIEASECVPPFSRARASARRACPVPVRGPRLQFLGPFTWRASS